MNKRSAKGNRKRQIAQRPAIEPATPTRGFISWIPPWLPLVVTFTSLLFGGHYAWDLLVDSGRLRVQQIEIVGTEKIGSQELDAYLGIQRGDDIFGADLDAAALGLKRHPWIKHANVRRRLPDTIKAQVWEHRPGLLVALSEIYVANQDGVLFKKLAGDDAIVMPVLTGLKRDDIENDAEQSAALIREAASYINQVGNGDTSSLVGSLDELHWDKYLGWSFIFRKADDVVTTHLGFHPLERLGSALAALRRLEPLARKPIEVWADGLTHRSRIQIRLLDYSLNKTSETLIAKAGDADG